MLLNIKDVHFWYCVDNKFSFLEKICLKKKSNFEKMSTMPVFLHKVRKSSAKTELFFL